METSLLRGGETRRGGKLWNVYQDFGIFDWGTFQEGKASKSYPGTKNTRRNTGNTRIDTTSGPKYKKKYRKDKDRYNFWTKIQQEIQVRQGKIQLLEQNTRINTGKTGENTASWTSLVIEWRHQRSAQRQHRTSRARVELLYMIIILIININHRSIYHYHKFVATADRVWLCIFFLKTAHFLE